MPCSSSQFSSPEAVLEGARYMVAMQIAREPLVRHVLRQTFQERAKINIKPTKKGKKVRALRLNMLTVISICNRSLITSLVERVQARHFFKRTGAEFMGWTE